MKRRLFFIAASGMCVVASFSAAFAQVKADSGSIAIGGSVTASTVIIGIPQQKVDELVRDAKRPLEEFTAQPRDNIVLFAILGALSLSSDAMLNRPLCRQRRTPRLDESAGLRLHAAL